VPIGFSRWIQLFFFLKYSRNRSRPTLRTEERHNKAHFAADIPLVPYTNERGTLQEYRDGAMRHNKLDSLVYGHPDNPGSSEVKRRTANYF
jgi:hypothetical protein